MENKVCMQSLFDRYISDVTLWHKINTFPHEFGPAEVRFYMGSELMIRQELHETIKAFQTSDTKEVLDGILDVYWEVIPVYNYFLNIYKYWVHHGYEPIPCHDLQDEFKILVRGFTKLDLGYHHDEICAIRMIFRLKLVCERLMETLFTFDSVEASMRSVVESNLSKFVYEPSQENAIIIASETSEALGEPVHVNWALLKDGNDVTTYLILKDSNGKVRKPKGHFVPAAMQVCAEDVERVNEFWNPKQATLTL